MNIVAKETTLKALSNAVELAVGVGLEIVGNDISDEINNSPITRDALTAIVVSRFTEKLSGVQRA